MRSDAQYLWDIIEAVDALERFVSGKTLSQFEQDEILRAAAHSKLMIIGEAVCHLSEGLTSKYPAVPWQTIKGFRNQVIHGYFKIDWEIMWNAATRNAPQLRDAVNEILQKEFPQFRPENT